MRLAAIRMRHVRRFGAEGIAVEDIPGGLSLLAAANEFGKTTLFEALQCALFEKHTSRGKKVRNLVAVEGQGPLIEIDFEAENRPWRLRKRFLNRPVAELIDPAGGHVVAAQGDACDRAVALTGCGRPGDGPVGLLWLRQGLSMEPPDAGETGRKLLAGMLEREVSRVSGGDDTRAVLTRVQAELAELVTAHGRPKTGPYRSAVDELRRASDALEEVRTKLTDSEHLLAQLAQTEERIRQLENPAEAERIDKELADARRRLTEARSRDRVLAEKERSRADRGDAVRRSERDLREFREARTRVAQLEEEIEKKRAEGARLEEDGKQLDAQRVELDRQFAGAEKKCGVAELVAEKCAGNERRVEAKRRAGELDRWLQRAQVAQGRIADLKARVEDNPVTSEMLSSVRSARADLERLDARLDAVRPVLRPALSPFGRKIVRLDGEPMDREARVAGSKQLSLGDLGAILIEATEPASTRAEYQQAGRRLAAKLEEARCSDADAAERAALDRSVAEGELKAIQEELRIVAPDGVDALREERHALDRRIKSTEKPDQDGPLPDLAEAEAERRRAREDRDRLDGELRHWQRRRDGVTEEQGRTTADISGLRGEYGPLIDRLGGAEQLAERENALVRTAEAVIQAEREIAREIDEARKGAVSAEDALTDVQRLEQAQANHRNSLSAERLRAVESSATLSALSAEGLSVKEARLQQKSRTLERRVAAFEHKAEVLRLLETELTASRERLREQFLEPVTRELRPLLHLVVPDADITLDEEFRAEHLSREGRIEPLASLSGGMREQIAVLVRLAFARLMAKKGQEMPVVLDDALVWCDDRRLESVFRALHAAAREIQCVVLTCHHRAFATLGAFELQPRPWPDGSEPA